MHPEVSIIIPTYNRAHLLPKTLETIIGQNYKDWECIIVDDGSTDHTETLIASYTEKDKRFQFFKRPPHLPKGPNACRKYGFEKSQGKYIAWFDSDDVMHPDKLLSTVNLFKNTELDGVFHNFNYFRPKVYSGDPFNTFGNVPDSMASYFSGETILNFQTSLWKRSKLNMAFMRDDLSYAEDVFFIGNHLLEPNFKIALVNKVLVSILKHEDSLTLEFAKRTKHLIDNEVYVRQYFWDVLKKRNHNASNGALKMYLKALKYYMYARKYGLFFKNMVRIFKPVNLKTKFIVLKLNIVALFYIFTKKGMTYYQKVVNAL